MRKEKGGEVGKGPRIVNKADDKRLAYEKVIGELSKTCGGKRGLSTVRVSVIHFLFSSVTR